MRAVLYQAHGVPVYQWGGAVHHWWCWNDTTYKLCRTDLWL